MVHALYRDRHGPIESGLTVGGLFTYEPSVLFAIDADLSGSFTRQSHMLFVPTGWLRQAGPMIFDCQLTRDPGLACSRLVRRPWFRACAECRCSTHHTRYRRFEPKKP